MSTHGWNFNFVPLSKRIQVYVSLELLVKHQSLASEFCVGFLIGPISILFASTVAGSHGRVVRHLLCQIIECICLKLVGFA
jgi:hypothetical protein